MPQGADGSCPGPMKAAVLLLLLCITALSVVVLSTSPALSSELPDQRFSLSISPLNNHIRALVPGRGLQDGTAMPVALNRSMTEHQFATFCAAGAVNLSAFRMTVQRLEERILTETAPRRGLYELVADSDGEHRPRLTSRSDRYNIFLWDEPWVGQYFWTLKRAFHSYAKLYSLDLTKPLFIKAWANCFRPGQHITWHEHGEVHSGTFFVAVPGLSDPTSTSYMFGGKLTSVTNVPGDLILFSGIGTPHRSSELTAAQQKLLIDDQGSECRISSSFDISADPTGLGHSVPFYDPEDTHFVNDPSAAEMVRYGSGLVRSEQDDSEDEEEQEQEEGEGGGKPGSPQLDEALKAAVRQGTLREL